MALGVDDLAHVAIAAGAGVVVVVAAWPGMRVEAAPDGRPAGVFGWPARALLLLGVLAFAGLLAEGAVADWSAVYLHDSLTASPAVAAVGFAAFSLAMTIGRLTGDRLVGRLGPGAHPAWVGRGRGRGSGRGIADRHPARRDRGLRPGRPGNRDPFRSRGRREGFTSRDFENPTTASPRRKARRR
jgi:hypothetical protein